MTNLKISIITINYNNKSGLEKTIESVLCQTYDNIEYLVIDGNSTDGSKEVIEKHKHRISYWVSEPDSGIYNAMNKGGTKATGDYLLFLNSGDVLYNRNVIEYMVHQVGNEDIVMGYVYSESSKKICYDDVKFPVTFLDFYRGNPIPHPSSLIKQDLYKSLLYDENLRIVSDWKFFLQAFIFRNCTYKMIPYVVTSFEDGGVSSDLELCKKEKNKVLNELFPERLLLDYFKFLYGGGYNNSDYDKLFVTIRKYNYSSIIYLLALMVVRFISLFKTNASFSRKLSLFWKSEHV